MREHFCKEHLWALQVFWCALVSRFVYARTRTRLRGNIGWGPSIKYITFEGEGVRGMTVCDRGGGKRACDVTL